jgi:formate dehydrogenase maturation protein FdhE
MKKIATILMVMILMPFNVMAQEENTDPGITPDSIFYGLDKAFEKVQLALEKDEIAKAKLHLEFANERVAEARSMADSDKLEYIPDLAEQYRTNIDAYQVLVETAQDLGQDTSDVDELVATATSIHIAVLEEVLEKVPEQAKPAIRNAINQSEVEQEESLNRLGNVEPETAAEISLRIAERHLLRAQEMVEAGDMEEAEDLIEEYNLRVEMTQLMIEKAREMGKDTTDIEKIVFNATSIHQDVLQNVSEQMPEEAMDAIKKAMNVSSMGQLKAVDALNISIPPRTDIASAGIQEDGIHEPEETTTPEPEEAQIEEPDIPSGRP